MRLLTALLCGADLTRVLCLLCCALPPWLQEEDLLIYNYAPTYTGKVRCCVLLLRCWHGCSDGHASLRPSRCVPI